MSRGEGREIAKDAKVKLWCFASRREPVVGVVARVHGEPMWTCILRWDWRKRTVEEGAWTKMRIHAGRCYLSEAGEFLLYHATGPNEGPFSGSKLSGAYAISRLPWLSALTNPDAFGYVKGGKSRDALSEDEQQLLWGIFEGCLDQSDHLVAQLRHPWQAVMRPLDVPESVVARGKGRLVAKVRIATLPVTLWACVTRKRWNLWDGHIQFSILADGGEALHMPAWRWARPVMGGRVLVATPDARLQIVRLGPAGAEPEVKWEHDLSGLKPEPGPAPSWAKAPLKS